MNPQPAVLPRVRAATNLRRTRLFLLLFGLAALPSVAYVAQYLMLWGAFVLVPLAGNVGLVAFLILDALVVVLAMILALAWLYRSAMNTLLRSVNARRPHAAEAREFEMVVENMAIASGLPVPPVYLMDVHAPNLLAVGVSPQDSTIVASTGLIALLDRSELEAVAAHALAQIGNRDTQLDTLLAAGVRWLGLPGTLLLKLFRGVGRLASRAGLVGWAIVVGLALWLGIPLLLSLAWGVQDSELRPWVALTTVLNLYVLVGAPLAVALVARLVARERKHLADAEAIELTRYPVGLVQALAKIEAAGSAYPQAGAASANLHFADPIPAGSWWARLFDSHPPAAERIAVVSRLGGIVSPAELRDARAEGTAYAASVSEAVVWHEDPIDAPSLPDGSPARLSLIRFSESAPLLIAPDGAAA
ncbi:MAG TPA: M48 family metalloprotease, partial [Tepidiformaceae bacterium]|nr:M48 family metalloprotease [Tepidiformaceae bacterium]